ncbi:hypothetical protein BBJ28_00016368 [Nothophytophthora sp. Chile5]|nr:hypothetical protein BBJ28_00016368 [Nothophytophthora sp. Chile5]
MGASDRLQSSQSATPFVSIKQESMSPSRVIVEVSAVPQRPVEGVVLAAVASHDHRESECGNGSSSCPFAWSLGVWRHGWLPAIELSMDARASTAPALGRKRWVPKASNGSARLLRLPSVLDHSSEDPARPHTCPTPTLTPQFHWNLNATAIKALRPSQLTRLYGLFQFYDSSATGDSLPSINCARLLEILRDAHLLSDPSRNSAPRKAGELQAKNVEQIFAQAAMGKMRVYLDADDQPALPFPVFCGALLNCAMLLAPSMPPTAALQSILPPLFDVNGHHASTSKSLLGHLPTDGVVALWIPDESHGQLERPEDARRDYRALLPFQQVIADCTRDKVVEELRQQQLTQQYLVPPQLSAGFHPATLTLISNKFRLFDVFDRGALPRHEIFPLLSSLGKRGDLSDPYAVLAQLNELQSGPLEEGGSSGSEPRGEVTLVQLLQVIGAARDATRHVMTARHAVRESASSEAGSSGRVNAAPSDGSPSTVQARPMSSLAVSVKEEANDNEEDDHEASSISNSHNSLSKERGKKLGGAHAKSRKHVLTQGAANNGVGHSTHTLLGGKHHAGSKALLVRQNSISGKKKADLHRKPSAVDDRAADAVSDEVPPAVRLALLSSHDDFGSNSGATDLHNDRHPADFDDQYSASAGAAPPRVKSGRKLHISMLLGGDHDGAICCTLSLALATREIVESEGIHYSTAPSQTTLTAPVLPTQSNLTSALLMLKKCVLAKQERGFELRPSDQLENVDGMLSDLQKRQPHFSLGLRSTAKTERNKNSQRQDTPLTVQAAVSKRPLGSASSRELASRESSASSASRNRVASDRSLSRGRREPPMLLQSPPRHQLDLPSNFKDMLSAWEVSQDENYTWITNVNAASPLKSASPVRSLPPKTRNPSHKIPSSQQLQPSASDSTIVNGSPGGPCSPLRLPSQ